MGTHGTVRPAPAITTHHQPTAAAAAAAVRLTSGLRSASSRDDRCADEPLRELALKHALTVRVPRNEKRGSGGGTHLV